jgi:uncharacterized protein YuzE
MQGTFLEVTFRRGRALAAYLYLPREPGAKSVRVERLDSGMLVDFAANGKPLGIEITSPRSVTLEALNRALSRFGLEPLLSEDLAPLKAA